MNQRDVFLDELYTKAIKDQDVILMSPDMGSASLDIWRKDIPKQFFACGISEQNVINVASGFSNRGKKVYVFMMACWCARCLEQIRYSCAMAKNPITILGNSVGLGYAPAGPAHEPNDDIAYMKSICQINIFSPLNCFFTKKLVDLTYNDKKLRYIRFERTYDESLDQYYLSDDLSSEFLDSGASIIFRGKSNKCIISSGYMMGRALKIAQKLNITLIDLWKIPVNTNKLLTIFNEYNKVITIEEQSLSGGIGSSVCEVICDFRLKKDVLRIGLPNYYIFDNGTRDSILDKYGLSFNALLERVFQF